MKNHLIVYWMATAVIGPETLAGGITDLLGGRATLVSGPFAQDLVTHLGYPPYLLTILGFWKVLGAIVILAPGLPRLKEWAYAGVFFELTGAAASWALHGDPAAEIASPIVLAAIALASWMLRPASRRLGVVSSGTLRA